VVSFVGFVKILEDAVGGLPGNERVGRRAVNLLAGAGREWCGGGGGGVNLRHDGRRRGGLLDLLGEQRRDEEEKRSEERETGIHGGIFPVILSEAKNPARCSLAVFHWILRYAQNDKQGRIERFLFLHRA